MVTLSLVCYAHFFLQINGNWSLLTLENSIIEFLNHHPVSNGHFDQLCAPVRLQIIKALAEFEIMTTKFLVASDLFNFQYDRRFLRNSRPFNKSKKVQIALES